MLNTLEQNVVNSFRLAKSDIIKLQGEVISINQAQKALLGRIDGIDTKILLVDRKVKEYESVLKEMNERLRAVLSIITKRQADKKVITKVVTKRASKLYLASKAGNKFHISHCPFAKNIKPKSQIRFKSKNAALNKGFKPCKCV